MFSKIYSGAIYGISGHLVGIETDISDGFPSYTLVGYLASEVKEARERVSTALKNSGFHLPAKKIIVNLTPAGVRKQGTAFDLPIALTLLSALGYIPQTNLQSLFAIGELSLNGRICPVKGILPLMITAKEQGLRTCIVPMENATEACLVDGLEIIPMPDLKAACLYFSEGEEAYIRYMDALAEEALSTEFKHVTAFQKVTGEVSEDACLDFVDIYGQEELKRALVVAASGMHHILMIGPPGCGKSMSAKRVPDILPPMSLEESLEVSRLYSVAGQMDAQIGLIQKRPFRSPHHTIPVKALTGGGSIPVPGEISLAHRGVLFLDELAEFLPGTLEVLREPLEDGVITLNRLNASFVYPAKFMLVAAMNPCRCGYYPDRNRCRCTEKDVYRYMHRISRPLLDRIDLCVDVQPPDKSYLYRKKQVLSTAAMRQMVLGAQQIQAHRFQNYGIGFNSEMTTTMMDEFCHLDSGLQGYLDNLVEHFGLSVRGRHKLLKVARTIADLDDAHWIKEEHLTEAACYRMIDRSYWEM